MASHVVLAARRGVAALEFALTVPALVFLLFGMYDLANGWITSGRLTTATFAIGQIATTLAVHPNGTNSLSPDDAITASTAIIAALPQLTRNGTNYSVVLSEVVFSQNPQGPPNKDGTAAPPTFTGTVAWSANILGQGDHRLCRKVSPVDDATTPSLLTLPNDAFQANPVLVVDTTYMFTPLLLQSFIPQFSMRWASYFSSRSGVNTMNNGKSDLFIHYDDTSKAVSFCP